MSVACCKLPYNTSTTVDTVYLANIKFGEFKSKWKLAGILYGEQDNIDVDCE